MAHDVVPAKKHAVVAHCTAPDCTALHCTALHCTERVTLTVPCLALQVSGALDPSWPRLFFAGLCGCVEAAQSHWKQAQGQLQAQAQTQGQMHSQDGQGREERGCQRGEFGEEGEGGGAEQDAPPPARTPLAGSNYTQRSRAAVLAALLDRFRRSTAPRRVAAYAALLLQVRPRHRVACDTPSWRALTAMPVVVLPVCFAALRAFRLAPVALLLPASCFARSCALAASLAAAAEAAAEAVLARLCAPAALARTAEAASWWKPSGPQSRPSRAGSRGAPAPAPAQLARRRQWRRQRRQRQRQR